MAGQLHQKFNYGIGMVLIVKKYVVEETKTMLRDADKEGVIYDLVILGEHRDSEGEHFEIACALA